MSRADARYYMDVSASLAPHAHLVETALGRHLFVADGSRLFDVEPRLFGELGAAMASGCPDQLGDLLQRIGLAGRPLIDDRPLPPPDTHALSLAVAQKCNLGCTYCYAQQGEFGGPAKNMSQAEADRAVDLLVPRCQAWRAAQPRLPWRRAAGEPAGGAGR